MWTLAKSCLCKSQLTLARACGGRVRPWKDTDGKWYSAWSTDGCNGTSQWGPTPADNLKKVPCKPGGQLELLVSVRRTPVGSWRL